MAESKRDPQATARRTLDRDHASSLRQLAAGLPSVDHALDELISRANQTELDVGIWNTTADADHATQSEGWRDAEALDAEALDAEALDAEALNAEALDVELLEAERRDALFGGAAANVYRIRRSTGA